MIMVSHFHIITGFLCYWIFFSHQKLGSHHHQLRNYTNKRQKIAAPTVTTPAPTTKIFIIARFLHFSCNLRFWILHESLNDMTLKVTDENCSRNEKSLIPICGFNFTFKILWIFYQGIEFVCCCSIHRHWALFTFIQLPFIYKGHSSSLGYANRIDCDILCKQHEILQITL